MNKICIYLRKSRADEELEKTLGEGETLSKHRKALLKFAKEKKLNIVEIKEEIVSGESLFFRPKMLELLKEVENKQYTGVLVMDMQRLGRGNMQDQGIILETFKKSNTKIITPMKTYDLSNDFDEEYTEFEAFMSRKELKMINRRMQGGRVRSVEDGNYIATNPPLGYDIHWIKKSRTLKINAHECEIIKLIFKLYTEGNGAGSIAEHLNNLGYKTKFNNNFSRSSVLFILKNPIYIGKVTWKKKEIKKSKNPNKTKDTRTRDKSEWIVVDGKHEPIISMKMWNKAQEILNNKYHIPYQLVNGPANPLAGVVICSKCKFKMVMRKLKGIDRLLCRNNKCDNISNRYDSTEKAIVQALERYLNEYRINISNKNKTSNIKPYERQVNILEKELAALNEQKLKLFDFLERGIYDENTFLERSKNIEERITKTSSGIEKINDIINKEKKVVKEEDVIKFQKLLDGYKNTDDIKLKNELMKKLVNKVEYTKDKRGETFGIDIFPKLKP
ncbi:site-specific recombinase [Clostridium tetani]|uniref:recombinase family protein n=1 Tax=Clostridium tetani TaxID=1513 RepID=UPI000D216A29|nr:recombinase family protein [Clostridium tetani]AVP54487.1 recombinase family protein [Clostridium tetani]RXI75245.1 recombinase family protein [Clostridium tetani]WFN62879.1 recombinase family protein [Clostridium tetani]SUY55086.1 site-specific recombinase [Clostridium tetani]BDR63963.1 serine recombinase [Clostridium tetani]